MTRSRQTNRDSIRGSDSSDDDEEDRASPRGRKSGEEGLEVDQQLDAMMAENSKHSGQ